MVTYQDLRDWIATNKGEAVAQMLDDNSDIGLRCQVDVLLSELLMSLFVFYDSEEGDVFWYSIYAELVKFEESEQ